MPEVLDNPVIKNEISDDAFLEAASYADKGEDIPAELISAKPAEPRAAEPEPVPDPSAKPDNSEAEPEKKTERPRDELGRFTKTETGEDIPEAERKPAEAEKPETAYTKAQKERERQENLLKNFQKEKEDFRAESEGIREQLKREAEELRRSKEQRTSPDPSQNQRPRYSSGELMEAANTFEAQAEKAFEAGDGDAFKENLRLAREARGQAAQVYQLEQQAGQQEVAHRFQTVYAQHIDQAIKAEPELAKADSSLSKDVQGLLEQEPVFSHIPDGFAKAVQVAKWKRDAGSASELRETNKKLQAEIKRLNGLTQLNGSGPTSPPAQKSFKDMSDDEQNQYLLRQAEKADAGQL
jgi:hypothetical protein